MSVSDSTKTRIFHQLAEYLQAGIPLPKAIDQFAAASAYGRVRVVLRRLRERLSGRLGEDFRAAGFSEFDAGMIDAGDRSGRLEEVFRLLETHYEERVKWRLAVRVKLIYPVVVFHLGAVLLSIPAAILAKDAGVFWKQSLTLLGGAYAAAFLAWLTWRLLQWLAQKSPEVERTICGIPFFGRVARALRSERFARAFAMQLRAGVTVLSAARLAARASGSGALQREAGQVEERVRAGAGLAQAWGARSLLVPELREAIATGEHTGRLDSQCLRIAEALSLQLRAWADWTATWLPRLIYLIVVGFVAWQIFQTLSAVYSPLGKLLEQ